MDSKCDNTNCPMATATASAPKLPLFVCSGCSVARYCSQACQEVSWSSHKQACRLHPPPHLAGISVRVVEQEARAKFDGFWGYGGFDQVSDVENEFSAQKIHDLKIEHTEAGKTVEVGYVKLQVIDIPMTRRNGRFFDCLDEYSHELGKLALHFDRLGYLRPNEGCWSRSDFEGEKYLVYIQDLVLVAEEWRGRGLGTWLLPKLFDLRIVHGAHYLFAWPTVLNSLEPPNVNGPFGALTPVEDAAWLFKRHLIITFFQKAGFRRLANGEFFCLAKNASHPSHSITIAHDAPFKELPPPDTEEEALRRYMANH
ncbi:hypothetical protein DFH06DRAFT_1164625 [Mycena polygramma]|nr:hypothetical protein DFH06DRAFT_1164625 [Mycena polygramma]